MSDVQKKIDEIEAEMARTQKNKATNYVSESFGAAGPVRRTGIANCLTRET